MSPLNELTDLVDQAAILAKDEDTLPYDLRAEIDWVDFSCTANPLGTPQRIRQAIGCAIAEGDLAFTPNRNGSHLANVLARYYEVAPECFLVGTSVSSMISAVAQAYRSCNVAVPTPAPMEYLLAVNNVGHNPIKLRNPFSLSAMAPSMAFSNGVKFTGAVLANPSYPCARLLSEETLMEYLEVCNWVVVDESNVNLTLGGDSYVRLTQKHPNLLVIRSISADLGLSGIPMGYVVGHPETIQHIAQFSDGTNIGMFHEVVAKHLPCVVDFEMQTQALLDDEIPWMQCMLSLVPGIKVYPSEANFVMCSLEARAGRDFGLVNAQALVTRLQKLGFTVRDLTGVPGIEGDRNFLVSIRSHEDNERFVNALRQVITT